MLKRKGISMAIMVMVIIGLLTTPAFARAISMKDAGIALWIFIILGAVIILLQLIPAAILFFTFVGTTSATIFKGKKAEEETTEVAPGYEPAPVKK